MNMGWSIKGVTHYSSLKRSQTCPCKLHYFILLYGWVIFHCIYVPHLLYGPRDCHTEWSKSYRERQISYDMAYMWNLKNGTNELI